MFRDKMMSYEDPSILANVFSTLTEGSNRIVLWQSPLEDTRRLCQYARVGQLNLPKSEMTFWPCRGEFYFNFHSYLYFFGLRRTTIFKASILYHSRLKIVIRLPQQIMMTNSREATRQDFSQIESLIQYVHNPSREPGLESLYLSSKLIDYSSSGLSFKSSLSNVVRFTKGDRIWVRAPFTSDLLEGEVRHVTKLKDARTGESYLRVGVKT